MAEITKENEEALKKFDPTKPLVVNCAEIEGLEDKLGRFIFRRANVRDELKIGIVTHKYTENATLDPFHENLAFILATFSVVCTEKPAGFEFDEMFDTDPLFRLYTRYTEWVNLFRLQVQQRKEVTGAAQ